MKKCIIAAIIFLIFGMSLRSQEEQIKNVACEEASQLIERYKFNHDFMIIDVRTKEMFEAEHIENSVQHDVFSPGFADWINTLERDKIYLVYCNIGKRSGEAVNKMKGMNFKHIYHLYEGIRVWKEKGFPTIVKLSELELVKKTINDVFGWAVNKDFDLFFNTIADDTNFISVTPYARVKFGIDAVKKDTSFWGSPNFKAIRHELYDLRINFSEEGSVAWFYCVLDDINTWKGEPANWEKVRWTGVLEKRNGKWRVVQQHFSWPHENS